MKRQSLLSKFNSLIRQVSSTDKSDHDKRAKLEDAESIADQVISAIDQLVTSAEGDADFESTVLTELVQAATAVSETGTPDVLILLREQIVSLSKSVTDIGNDKVSQWNHAVRNLELGDAYKEFAIRAKAETAFDYHFNWFTQAVGSDPDDLAALRGLGVAYNRLGNLYLESGRLIDAEQVYKNELGVSKKLVSREPDDFIFRREFGVAYMLLSELYVQTERLSESEAAAVEALDVFTQLVERDPANTQFRSDLASASGLLGEIRLKSGRLSEAEEAFDRCHRISQQILQIEPGNRRHQVDFCKSCEGLGKVYLQTNRHDQAKEVFSKGFDLARQLVEHDPYRPQTQLIFAISQWNLSRVSDKGESERLEDAAWELMVKERERDAYFFRRAKEAEDALRASIEARNAPKTKPKKRKRTTVAKKKKSVRRKKSGPQ